MRNWDSISVFNPAYHGDKVQFPDGTVWTVRNRMGMGGGLSLVNTKGELHPTIQNIASQLNFGAAIWTYGNSLADKEEETND